MHPTKRRTAFFCCLLEVLFLSVASGFCQFFPLQVDFSVSFHSKMIMDIFYAFLQQGDILCFFTLYMELSTVVHSVWISREFCSTRVATQFAGQWTQCTGQWTQFAGQVDAVCWPVDAVCCPVDAVCWPVDVLYSFLLQVKVSAPFST